MPFQTAARKVISVLKKKSQLQRFKLRRGEYSENWNLLISTCSQKMKFAIKEFFSKCEYVYRKLQIYENLLKNSLMKTSVSVQ